MLHKKGVGFRSILLVITWLGLLVIPATLIVLGQSSGLNFLPVARRGWPPPTPTPLPGWLLISEVLYDPIGSEPEGEWIEIYNAGGSPVELGEYKIGDAWNRWDNEGMFQFPPESRLLPGQVLVIANRATVYKNNYGRLPDYELNESDPFVPTLSKYTAWANTVVSLGNTGDEVLLLNGNDERWDGVSWGNSKLAFDPPVHKVSEGHSIERSPAYRDTDRPEDWIDQAQPQPGSADLSTPTPTASVTLPPTLTPTASSTATSTPTLILSETPTATATTTLTSTQTQSITPTSTDTPSPTPEVTPEPAHLLITEVLYDPVGAEPDGEWIELYNPTESSIDLSNFKVGDEEQKGGTEGMLQFPNGVSIAAGQVIVIANKATAFYSTYGFKPDYEMSENDPTVPNMIKYSAWASGTVALNNTGDDVLVLDGSDQVVDALSWGTSTWAFDPPAPDVVEGHSLARSPAGVDTDTAADWIDQVEPQPGQIN